MWSGMEQLEGRREAAAAYWSERELWHDTVSYRSLRRENLIVCQLSLSTLAARRDNDPPRRLSVGRRARRCLLQMPIR